MNGIEHILKGVGRMCVIHNGCEAFGRVYRLQSSADALQRAEHHENVLRLLAQHHCRSVNGEQVADIELAYKLHSNLVSVDVEIHSLKVALYDASPEVCHGACGVGLHLCLRVLHHHHTVLVVGIGYGECVLWQHVEEGLLSVAVVLEGLVVVEVVAG